MRKPAPFSFWQFVLGGFLTFGRGFAYLGVAPLFIGEVFIARSVLANHRRWIQQFFDDFFHGRLLALGIGLTLLWGMFELFRTFAQSTYPTIDAIKTFAFNYYPLCVLIGMAYGGDMTVDRFVAWWKKLAIFYACYALVYPVAAIYDPRLPWNDSVAIFNVPSISGLMPVALLALWPYLRDWKLKYPVLLLSFFPLMYYPGRGAILGLALGLGCVALVSVQRVLMILFGTVAVFVAMSAASPMIERALGDDAPQIDPMRPLARLVATVNEDAAIAMLKEAGYVHEAEEMAVVAAGTASWRTTIWEGAVRSLDTTTLMLIGQGHGADLGKYTPHGEDIRTPHNYVIYLIFYTGAIGLGLFHLLLLGLLVRAWAIPNRNFRAATVGIILLTCMMALVGNLFETPFAAIPFFLLTGVLLGLNYSAVPATVLVYPPQGYEPILVPEPARRHAPRPTGMTAGVQA